MIEIKPTINFVESHDFCRGCGKDKVPTWEVSLSWKIHEELCEDCLYELYNKLSDTLMGIQIKKGVNNER